MLNDIRSPIRVVVVDDSLTVREMLVAIFAQTEDIRVIGIGANGEDAVRLVKRLHPDLVTLDVRMPTMDGFEATRQIMRECPTPIVIISASMRRKDVDLTFKALQAGALTAINKPGLNDPEACENVVNTVRLMAGVRVIHHWGRGKEDLGADLTPHVAKMNFAPPIPGLDIRISNIAIIGIAASTGGPSALSAVLSRLDACFPLPVLVVQHISTGFAQGLADWLSTQTKLRVEVAEHGDNIKPGTLLLAPDDYHMLVNKQGVVELSKSEPYKGLRPSANYLFDSLARVYGPRAIGVIMTGMGDDGADGMNALHSTGGLTIAQDEESCVVFGMPYEAIRRNAVDRILSLSQIAMTLDQMKKYTQASLLGWEARGRIEE